MIFLSDPMTLVPSSMTSLRARVSQVGDSVQPISAQTV
jgi:hypothetical protein